MFSAGFSSGDCSRADAFPDFNQVLVHGFDVDGRQDQSAANATGRADGAEQIRPVEAPVAQCGAGGRRVLPRSGSAYFAARPLLRPGTRFRPACHRRARRAPPSLRLRSFFESLLGCWIRLRVLRANGETAELQPPQQLAYAAFVQADAKLGRDAITQIGAAEPDDAVAGQIGALLDPGCQLALLDPAQARGPAASRPVGKPIQTCLIIAVNPVSQRLTIHPAKPRRRLAAEAVEHHRYGQDARRLPGVRRSLGRRARLNKE
jgi:hypothetical protein